MEFKRTILALYCVLVGVAGLSGAVDARVPVVVEFFGKNSCNADHVVQETLRDILKHEDDVILVNCRIWYDDSEEVKSFAHQFCTDRYRSYNQKFGDFTYKVPSSFIVNGRWDANYQDIMPAIRLGRTDDVRPISMVRRDGALDISLPAIESATHSGEILLYVYAPTLDETAGVSDSSLADGGASDDVTAPMSVPFVTEQSAAEDAPFYVRPVLAIETLGQWSGEKMDFTFALQDISGLTDLSYEDLSYVVVLHAEDTLGSILAAGEIVSVRELSNTLPRSAVDDGL